MKDFDEAWKKLIFNAELPLACNAVSPKFDPEKFKEVTLSAQLLILIQLDKLAEYKVIHGPGDGLKSYICGQMGGVRHDIC